ncbi:histidine kinase dimerization/phospho-acceptor domain-containing protein [Rhizomicrobium electricum]|uniref:histidine kinase n=1 Tax=Rhizomicrobium electricum TaxID=480070 RepID=A0ABN1ETH3_9PROT|nr:two-component system cell cycle sensor histidine kinase PleC [Rhizomicrobium electricum]
MPTLFALAARRLQPKTAIEANLQIDLMRSVHANVRPAGTLVFGLFFGAFALQWTTVASAAIWTALIVLYPILTAPLRRRVFLAPYEQGEAGAFMVKALALMLPLHFVWAAYVPICWIDGNAGNNAFLVIFLLAGLISAVQIYGPCIQLSLPALLVYVPVISTHYLHTGNRLDAVLPVIQFLFCGLLAMVAIRHYKTFRESVSRRLTIEALVGQLEAARDAALAANKAKSSFLASMSHELRTPLNAIIGFSEIMSQGVLGPVSPAKYGEYVADIHDSGVRLLALINDLLDLSKIEAGRRELVETELCLAPLLDDLAAEAESAAAAAHVAITIAAPADLTVRADEQALRQIVQNFLSNAIKYSRPGGEVVLFASLAEGGALQVGVEDCGMGMDENGIRIALAPYSALTHVTAVAGRGTGLGLPLARALIELHGAGFHIESKPDVGTRVWCEFGSDRVSAGIHKAA